MNLTVTPSADALNLSVSADGTTYSLDVGTASPVNLSVSGGRGPAGIGNATLAAGNGITIAQSGNTATISSTRNSLGDLADVTLSSPAAGEVLTWNGTTWAAAADSTNLTGYATESYVNSAVANLVDSSPAALDTLNELAAAIGDDANFSATITTSLAGKAAANHTHTSADVTDFAAAASANAPIQSVNSLTGDIVLVAGTGLTLGQSGTTLTFDADLPPSNLADLADVSGSPTASQALIYNGTEWQPGDIPAGTTINTLSGDLTLAAGDNVTLETTGSTLTVSASGGGVSSLDLGTYPRTGSLLTEAGDTLTSEGGDAITPEQATTQAVLQLLRSNVSAAVPASLADGELAINTEDGLLFYANTTGAVQSFALGDYAAASHTHAIANVTGLQAALDEKAATASLATVATSGNYTDLSGIPTEFTPAAHIHAIANVTGLQAALDAKAATASLANVATSGSYGDLSGLPTLGTAAATNATDYATAAQGSLADSAVQPGDLASVATSGNYADLTSIPSVFAPTAHKSTHATGGSDFLTPSDIGAAPAASPTFTGVITVSAGTAAAPAIVSGTGTSDTGVFWPAADTWAVSTAGTERLRVDADGRISIGAGGSGAANGIQINRSLSGGSGVNGLISAQTVTSEVTSGANVFRTFVGTQAASFTLAALTHFRSTANTFGAGSTVTTQIGFQADNTLTGATNNYGFRGDIADGSGRWNFYASGTAPNYFAGNVGIGSGTTTPTAALDINSDTIRLRTAKTPASASDTGNAGDICWDASYLYICTATDTWRRIAHSTW